MARSNRLGAILRYMTDAVSYARGAFTSEKVRSVFRGLSQSGRTGGGGQGDLNYYSILSITNPAFYAGASLIAERVAAALDEFVVQEQQGTAGGKWVDVADHEFTALFRKPNSLMDGSTFLQELVYSVLLYGNHYWLINSQRPGVGPISEILYLPAQSTAPRPDTLRRSPISGELVIDYEYTLNAFTLMPGESIAHFRNANPFDYWSGLSLLTALQNNLQISQSQGNWLAEHYGEGNAIPSAVISLPADMDDIDFDQVEADIRAQFGGHNRTAVTRAGDMDVSVIQHTIADMQLLEAQRYLESQVRRVLHVPEAFDSASSGQARLAAETALARDAVQPMLNHIAETATNQIMPYYGRHRRYRLFANNIVPQDQALDATEYQVYSPDRTLNENRAKQGLPPIQLTGALAAMQAIYDEIPPRYLPILAPMLAQPAAPGQQGANGIAGVSGSDLVRRMTGSNLLDGMTGRLLVDSLAGRQNENYAPLIAMMTGQMLAGMQNGSQGGAPVTGYQMAGAENTDQILQRLIGAGAPMSSSEKLAIEYLLHSL